MAPARSHRELVVWRKAMDLVVEVYGLTDSFPPVERWGLRSQLTRAAASVPANIAEGNARGSARDYARFLSIARGSLAEAETFLLIALRLGYVGQEQAALTLALMDEVGRMLTTLHAKIVRRPPAGPNP